MIRSSEAEVLEDVERILKWAYSDRFTSRGAQYSILTEADIALVPVSYTHLTLPTNSRV